MLADVPQMTWFANIKMLLWRFVDKMDGEDGRADPLEQWIWACTVPARRCSGGPQVPESLKAQDRRPAGDPGRRGSTRPGTGPGHARFRK
jgi:hypothetical protein